MRSFIVLLLLVVVFLAGLLIGIDREQSTYANILPNETNIIESTEQVIYWEEQEEEEFILENQPLNIEGPEQATQKIATFLEAGVKGFYEAVVEVLFQISSLFI